MDDGFLSRIAELYEMGIIDDKAVVTRVMAYQQQNNLDENLKNEFLSRVIVKKEYSLDEMKNFLANLTFNNGVPMYGEEIHRLPDTFVEEYFRKETNGLSPRDIDRIINKKKNTKSGNTNKVEEPINDNSGVREEEPPVNEKSNTRREAPVREEVHHEENNNRANRDNMPNTEEEFENIRSNVSDPERDSNVRGVDADPERMSKIRSVINR